MPTMCSAKCRSTASLHSSKMTKKRSKRDMMGADMLMLAMNCVSLISIPQILAIYLPLSVVLRLYRPPTGFAAARIEVRAFKVA